MKYKIIIIVFVAITVIIPISPSQIINLNNNQKYITDGEILFTPISSTRTYLINKNGDIVKSWNSSYAYAFPVYLVDNCLIRGDTPFNNPDFLICGKTGQIEKFDNNGSLIWNFILSNNESCLHHDIEVLPNGNILMNVWEKRSYTQAINAGRKIDNLSSDFILDFLIEVDEDKKIVWEWHVWDHLIQDYDATKDNYGIVKDHPELIDINCGDSSMFRDWNHINSIDYNKELDQILLSVHNFNEIWIIDHSTTTEEAAGHTGGNSGKGGDLLYRWGNSQAYKLGSNMDQKLFGQHDAQWIRPGYPGEGNILIFNNGFKRPEGNYSSIDEFTPPVDENGYYYLEPGCAYEPNNLVWTYIADNLTDFFALFISGAKRLPNGDTIICDGPAGKFFQVTPEKKVVWEYINNYPDYTNNEVFKIQYYPYKNLPPSKPTINGPTKGKPGILYEYILNATDPNADNIRYYIDWGDGKKDTTIFYKSNIDIIVNHTWYEEGTYIIKINAQDLYGLIGPESIFILDLPKNIAQISDYFWNFIIYKFQNFYKIF